MRLEVLDVLNDVLKRFGAIVAEDHAHPVAAQPLLDGSNFFGGRGQCCLIGEPLMHAFKKGCF